MKNVSDRGGYQKPGMESERTPGSDIILFSKLGFGNVRFGRLVGRLIAKSKGRKFAFFPLSIGEEIRVDELSLIL